MLRLKEVQVSLCQRVTLLGSRKLLGRRHDSQLCNLSEMKLTKRQKKKML